MILLQAITPQGAISANWALVIMVSIIGILIVTICSMVASHVIGTLRDFRQSLKNLHGRVDVVEDVQVELRLQQELIKKDIDPVRMAEIIYAKIKAAQG